MSRVKFQKVNSDLWFAHNSKTGDTAYVCRIEEYYAFGETKPKYRVDQNGQTVASMIEHFQTAKSIAMKKVK